MIIKQDQCYLIDRRSGGPYKVKLVKFFDLFQCQGDSFPHDRSRLLESKFTYVSSNFRSVEIKLSGFSGVTGVNSGCRC